MSIQNLQILLLAAFFSQTTATMPVRIGDIATGLTAQDVTTISSLMPPGGNPWLLFGMQRGGGQDFFDAYLPPQISTQELRRGSMVRFGWSPTLAAARGDTLERSKKTALVYAQVAVNGRSLDRISGEKDLARPFEVIGQFDDAEILSIAKLMRMEPWSSSNGRAVPTTPILSITRDSEEWATVQLDPATQPRPGNVARVILHRVNNLWTLDHLVIGQA